MAHTFTKVALSACALRKYVSFMLDTTYAAAACDEYLMFCPLCLQPLIYLASEFSQPLANCLKTVCVLSRKQ